MHMTRHFLIFILTGLVVSSCVLKDLRNDLATAEQEYGYFKGRVTESDDGSNVLIGLYKRGKDGLSIANIRTVNPGEFFYMLVNKADYVVLAFADLNGDFTYQPGEPAARINDPEINWFSDVQLQGRIDPETLQVQLLDLTSATVLEQELDFSIAASRRGTGVTKNFLRIVTWSDDEFSAESAKRGLWEPSWFKEEIGFGLYVLEEFDPTKKSILLVHGVLDSPRVFETIAGGKSEGNDGVVTVKSQLAGSAQRNCDLWHCRQSQGCGQQSMHARAPDSYSARWHHPSDRSGLLNPPVRAWRITSGGDVEFVVCPAAG